MLIGYARVSTTSQNLDLQMDALKKAGCEKIFEDTQSGARESRPGLDESLAFLRLGDVLVVWKLDRLGRTLRQLVNLVHDFESRGIGFKSLSESIDTTTSSGKLVFGIFSALAEFERSLIRERTMAGLESARARGKKGGRKPKLSPAQEKQLLALYSDKSIPLTEICHTFGITKQTIYKYLARAKNQSTVHGRKNTQEKRGVP